MSLSASSNHSRRAVYSASIAATDSCGPLSASTPAHCAIEFALEVEWPCTLHIALVHSVGASEYPIRHPVIAYVFENDPAMHKCDLTWADKLAALNTSAGG